MERNLEEVRKFFSGDKYATKLTGIEIEDAKENYSRCTLVLNDDHKNLFGDVMGGALFTLADFALAVAANRPDDYTATLTSEIRYLAQSKGSVLTAECNVIKNGRRTCFADIEIKDDLGVTVALVTASGMHIS